MRKIVFCAFLGFCAFTPVFPGGSKDTVDTNARTLESWQETVDIKNRKPGKYNILVTAEDLAGNQAFGGPFNMYIDPNSDLPVTRVTNPLMDMRVPGNLNIVGTCIDDDAVAYVELIFDNSVLPVRADGTTFWSYYLDTTGLSEGPHTITVTGVDINGVQGKPHTLTWHLDRNRPETAVTNPGMGTLVSGKFTLSGTVADGNGIKKLYYSLDAGKTFVELPLKREKSDPFWTFSFVIDSLGLKDGPSVCWFKAVDGQGSEGFNTFLYFVDNTKPDVGFITPRPDESVNGVFSASGYARDVLGIASLSWKMGAQSGTFELIKGNPYWVKEFDISGETGKTVELEIFATDVAGNLTRAVQKIAVDQSRDVPSISVTSPAAGALVSGPLDLAGFAIDDDGIAAVWYSLDKQEPVKLESGGAFGARLGNLPAGAHSIEAWPVDRNGKRGGSATVSFTVAGPPPAIYFEPVQDPASEVNPEAGAVLTAKISSPAGLQSAFWSLPGQADRNAGVKEGAKEATISVKVAPDSAYGLLSLDVRATDIHGRETRATLPFYVTNLAIPRDAPPASSDATLDVSREVVIPETGKTPASTGTARVRIERVEPAGAQFENGMVLTLAGPGRPKDEQVPARILVSVSSPIPVSQVTWRLNGGESARASVQKAEDGALTALIPLSPSLPAVWTTLSVEATLKDGTVIPASGVFCVVRPAPANGVFDDESFAWGGPARDSSGRIELFDGVAAAGLYNGKPDRRAVSVALPRGTKGLSAELSGNLVLLRGVADGEYADISLTITDDAGGTYRTPPATFVVDSAPPVLTVDASARPYWVQNSIPLAIGASDERGIASVEYSLDGGSSWKPVTGGKAGMAVDVSGLPDGKIEFLARATDRSGRVTSDWRVFFKDTVPPLVEVAVPPAGSTVNGETLIAFRHQDAGVLASAEYRAPGDRSAKDKTAYVPVGLSSLTNTMVGTRERPISDKMEFRFTDEAGNSTSVSSWPFAVDAKADLPVVEIHLPAENEVIRKDFVVSGVVYDDDAPAKVWYKIDKGAFIELPIEHSYSIPIALKSLTDNEHTITLYAEDIHGVRGEEVVRTIRVSLEEPKAAVRTPSFETTNRGLVDMTGVASDKNGIARVEISLDNGNTFNLAEGTEAWSYRFDTRVIQDGTHVVFVRVYDKYETAGLYSSLVNIDNTAPSIRLELPLDGSRTGETLFISGQTMDNINLQAVRARISNIEAKQPAIPASFSDMQFENELIISRGLDITALPEGFYNIEIRGYDRAGNVTRVSRNFEVYRGKDRNRVELLYPMNGERVQGAFNIYGKVVSEDPIKSLVLFVDGVEVTTGEVTPSGYYRFSVVPGMLSAGNHKITVRARASETRMIESESRVVLYRPDGAWVTIDNLVMGDFAIERPWLRGNAGYSYSAEEAAAMKDKETPKETKRALEARRLARVDISFDNGKSFVGTELDEGWKYRLETGDMREGYHFMIVRATMRDGTVAVTRTIVQVDKTAPSVRIISPGEGGQYNDTLTFSGLSSDDVKLDSVKLSLRPGDKSSYAIPAFIQGLYFDVHFWGATLFDVGVGLTFFDDNVKLQLQYGQFTQAQREMFTSNRMRYGGNVFGVKLLANIAYIPMDYFMGPDFSWLSATVALGANFSMFTETQSGQPQILPAALVQIEFPRVTLAKRKVFRTFSFYTEAQFWFITTDVDSSEVSIESILPHITGGIRLNVF